MQRLIVAAGRLGISKRELMEDYYLDELAVIFAQAVPSGELTADDF